MTEPRKMQLARQTKATRADREPEVKPELIQDLDVTSGDADVIRGGPKSTNTNGPL